MGYNSKCEFVACKGCDKEIKRGGYLCSFCSVVRREIMRQKVWKDKPDVEILAEVRKRRRIDTYRITIRKVQETKTMEREGAA